MRSTDGWCQPGDVAHACLQVRRAEDSSVRSGRATRGPSRLRVALPRGLSPGAPDGRADTARLRTAPKRSPRTPSSSCWRTGARCPRTSSPRPGCAGSRSGSPSGRPRARPVGRRVELAAADRRRARRSSPTSTSQTRSPTLAPRAARGRGPPLLRRPPGPRGGPRAQRVRVHDQAAPAPRPRAAGRSCSERRRDHADR